MKRKQIYIESRQESRIKALAFRRQVPEAVVIRELLEFGLDAQSEESPLPVEENPLLELIGIVDSDSVPENASTTYKRDLYG